MYFSLFFAFFFRKTLKLKLFPSSIFFEHSKLLKTNPQWWSHINLNKIKSFYYFGKQKKYQNKWLDSLLITWMRILVLAMLWKRYVKPLRFSSRQLVVSLCVQQHMIIRSFPWSERFLFARLFDKNLFWSEMTLSF